MRSAGEPMNQEPYRPPRAARWLLTHLRDFQNPYRILGDLEESFHRIAEERGRIIAVPWFWLHSILLVVQYIQNRVAWRLQLISNYLKTTIRHIRKNKIYSAINICGLAVGLACCMLIVLYVRFERSYDDYHVDADRIYRIAFHQYTSNGIRSYATSLGPLGPALIESFPQVESAVRIRRIGGESTVVTESGRFIEDRIICADSQLFEIFHIPFIEGDKNLSLRNPGTAIITESLARQVFGDRSCVGKRLQTIGYDSLDVVITGVIEDTPANSHLKLGIVTTMFLRERDQQWVSTHPTHTYIKLRPGTSVPVFEKDLNTFIDSRLRADLDSYGYRLEHFLQPLRSIHLYSRLRNELEPPGNPRYLMIFSFIGLFILLMAVFNFMNLSTARSTDRAREVGIRKVLGAHRRLLIGQFMGESMGFTAIAFILAFGIVGSIMPIFEQLTAIPLHWMQIFNLEVICLFILIALATGFLAGIYPAFRLSSFLPVYALKRGGPSGDGKHRFRSMLVVGQFVISVSLIIATGVVFRQVDYMRDAPLGFDTEQKLVIRFHRPEMLIDNFETVKQDLRRHPSVNGVTASSSIPGRRMFFWRIWPQGKQDEQSQPIYVLAVDTDFFEEYEIRTVAGRPFDREHLADNYEAGWIFNEPAVEAYGWTSAEEGAHGRVARTGHTSEGGDCSGSVPRRGICRARPDQHCRAGHPRRRR